MISDEFTQYDGVMHLKPEKGFFKKGIHKVQMHFKGTKEHTFHSEEVVAAKAMLPSLYATRHTSGNMLFNDIQHVICCLEKHWVRYEQIDQKSNMSAAVSNFFQFAKIV